MRSLKLLCHNKFSPAGLSPALLDSHILSLHSQLHVPPPSPACWGRSVPEHEGNVHLLLLSVFSPSLTSSTSSFFCSPQPLLSYLIFASHLFFTKLFSTNTSLVCTSWGLSEPAGSAGSAHAGLSFSTPRAANFCISAQSSQWFLTLRFLPRLIRFVQRFFQLLLSFESGTWKTFHFWQSGIMGFLSESGFWCHTVAR